MVQCIVTLTNHDIDRAGFKLHGAPGTLKIFAKSSCQIQVNTKKKVLLFENGAIGTMPSDRSTPGYCITFIKRLD